MQFLIYCILAYLAYRLVFRRKKSKNDEFTEEEMEEIRRLQRLRKRRDRDRDRNPAF